MFTFETLVKPISTDKFGIWFVYTFSAKYNKPLYDAWHAQQ